MQWPRYKMQDTSPHSHQWRPRLVKESLRPRTDVKNLPKKARCIVIFILTRRVFNIRHFNPFRRPVSKPLVTESPRTGTDVKTFSKRGAHTGIAISTATNNCFDLRHFNSHCRRISTSQNISCTPSRALNMLSKNLAALGSNLSQAISWKE